MEAASPAAWRDLESAAALLMPNKTTLTVFPLRSNESEKGPTLLRHRTVDVMGGYIIIAAAGRAGD
jgi:hypothetical protein